MFFVWRDATLIGMYAQGSTAKAVARAVMGTTHITEQSVLWGTVMPAHHWWFF